MLNLQKQTYCVCVFQSHQRINEYKRDQSKGRDPKPFLSLHHHLPDFDWLSDRERVWCFNTGSQSRLQTFFNDWRELLLSESFVDLIVQKLAFLCQADIWLVCVQASDFVRWVEELLAAFHV